MAIGRHIYFPLPHASNEVRADGSIVEMPAECRRCNDRECERSEVSDSVSLCRYGFNFVRLSRDLLAFGFLVAGEAPVSKRHRSRIKDYGRSALHPAEVERLLARRGEISREDEAQAERELVSSEAALLGSSDQMAQLVERLKTDIQKSAGQLHDYIDLASQIVKQLNVYMSREHPDIAVPDDLDHAPDELQSIYWLARLMEEKISAFGYYLNPEAICEEEDRFRLHGLITKYRKMYARACQQKKVRVVVGADYSVVVGNKEALGVLVHSLFDNSVKYAPADSEIRVSFHRPEGDTDHVVLRIRSLGPRMTADEQIRVFLPFVRGAAAERLDVEGMGFGLAFAQMIATSYGQSIEVQQDGSRAARHDYYETEFSFPFRLSGTSS